MKELNIDVVRKTFEKVGMPGKDLHSLPVSRRARAGTEKNSEDGIATDSTLHVTEFETYDALTYS